MAAAQIEGADTGLNPTDDIGGLETQLKKKKVWYIVDICTQYDEDVTLEALLEYRKTDILELIDEINNDDSNDHSISVVKKNKFAKIVSQYAAQANADIIVAMPNNENDFDASKHV